MSETNNPFIKHAFFYRSIRSRIDPAYGAGKVTNTY